MKNHAGLLIIGAVFALVGVAGAASSPRLADITQVIPYNDCMERGVLLADFERKVSAGNYGSYWSASSDAWFAFSDTSSKESENADSATGGSTIHLNDTGKIWSPFVDNGARTMPIAVLHATLEKNNSSSTYRYHPYAGWADLGIRVSPEKGTGVDLTGLKAISFDFYAGTDLIAVDGIVPPAGQTYGWNGNVPGIVFMIDSPEIEPSDAYQIEVPISRSGGARMCVELESLARPSSRTKKDSSIPKPFSPSNITSLRWEVRIAGQGDSAIHTADVAFGIASVTFYGIDETVLSCRLRSLFNPAYCEETNGLNGHRVGGGRLHVAYDQGLTLSYAFPGAEPVQVDVRRVDGVRVASFSRQAAVADHLRLPVALTPGTYLVNVRSGPAIRSARLAVVR